MSVAALSGTPAPGDEADARALLQAMSDYLTSQEALSFEYDSMQEVVTDEGEKLGLAASGSVSLQRPDRLRATRADGFTQFEMAFDGETVAMKDDEAGVMAQAPMAGGVDDLIDALRDTYGRPLPAADLLGSDPSEVLMADVTEVKDLGSGIVGGVECDHLAFRTELVDWQIWIAQGEENYPCMFVITSRDVPQAPQYRVSIRDWRSGAAEGPFEIAATEGISEVNFESFSEASQIYPDHFTLGDEQ